MLKRSIVLIIVFVLIVSFSLVALAEEKSPNNQSGVKVLENEEGKVSKIEFLPAVNEKPTKFGNTQHLDNPILVAGS